MNFRTKEISRACPLMLTNIEDWHFAGRGAASRLLHDESHGEALVKHAQLALRRVSCNNKKKRIEGGNIFEKSILVVRVL
jgi:hypothetical protein